MFKVNSQRCLLWGLLGAVLGLAACGSSGSKDAHGGGVAAQVNGARISESAVKHRMAIAAAENGTTVPDPPSYSDCVARLQSTASSSNEGGAKPDVSKLRAECQKKYSSLLSQALGYLISAHWLIGEAAEDHVPASRQAAQSQLADARKKLFPGSEAYERFLKSSGKTTADVTREFEVNQASMNLHKRIEASVPTVSSAEVARQYAEHPARYALPQRRDVQIIRTSNLADAERVKREIASGQSFAKVVARIPLVQPIGAKDGLARDLSKGFYREKRLDDAIFNAKPNVLMGPVKIILGYYVFEVKGIKAPRHLTLREVQGSIRRHLPLEERQRALERFVKEWRAKWTARTSCSPSFVVAKCRQYQPPAGAPPEEATALN